MNNIRKARENVGISQKDVSLILEVSAPTVSEWENGKKSPSVLHLGKMADLYNVTTDYLLGRCPNVEADHKKETMRFMFFDIFSDLCKKKGVSCKKAAGEIGLSNSITTKWKKTGATPDGKSLQKIAKYFSVSVDYLLGCEESKKDLDDSEYELIETGDEMSDTTLNAAQLIAMLEELPLENKKKIVPAFIQALNLNEQGQEKIIDYIFLLNSAGYIKR